MTFFEFAIRHLVLRQSFMGQIIWCRRKRSGSLTFITDELEAFCWACNYFHILNIWTRLLFLVSYFLLTFKAKFIILGKTTLKMGIKPYQRNGQFYLYSAHFCSFYWSHSSSSTIHTHNSDIYLNSMVMFSQTNLMYIHILQCYTWQCL